MRTFAAGVAAWLLCSSMCSGQKAGPHWVGTWSASPIGEEITPRSPSPANATYRNIVHISLGGSAVRILFTNEFGTTPLQIGAAHVAMAAKDGAIEAGTDHAITFDGRPSVSVPAGAYVVSDPVAMMVPAYSNVTVSTYLPQQPMEYSTCHDLGFATNFVYAGDRSAALTPAGARRNDAWCFLKSVEVSAEPRAAAVVALGDSITDGARSSPDEDRRWTDVLASRLQQGVHVRELSVLNQGIGGNRLLHDDYGPSALARFDRDVLSQTGVDCVVVLEGINDIGRYARTRKPDDKVSTEDLIFAYTQLARRAHARGLRIIAGTLLPYKGAGYYSEAGDAMRASLNKWIRGSGLFDGVIDFDAVMRDPKDPGVLQKAYDSGDHLHPNDAGYRAMGEAVDLSLFER